MRKILGARGRSRVEEHFARGSRQAPQSSAPVRRPLRPTPSRAPVRKPLPTPSRAPSHGRGSGLRSRYATQARQARQVRQARPITRTRQARQYTSPWGRRGLRGLQGISRFGSTYLEQNKWILGAVALGAFCWWRSRA